MLSTLRPPWHFGVAAPVGLVFWSLACGNGGEKEQSAPRDSSGGAGAGASAGGGPEAGEGGARPNGPRATRNTERDVRRTHLALDLQTQTAVATIELAPSPQRGGATLEVGDLVIHSVVGADGSLHFSREMGPTGALLDIGIPASNRADTLEITYGFSSHQSFDGWNARTESSFLWPYFCGNLFPCRSAPADGAQFSMSVSGYAEGLTALYPASLETDAPSYMPAVTVGELRELALGRTSNGTQLSAWLRPGQDVAAATEGTRTLVGVFDFYEQTYGPYAFGDKAGSVAVDWGTSGFRGMEHHPYWHINQNNFGDAAVHAHEAAHGWFGNGVRLECWEDFVLSEGTATYLAARALERVGVDVWPEYECRLLRTCQHVVLKERCGGADILTDPIGSAAPYMKGAFFFRDVAELLGPEELDATLAEFYSEHVGEAASFDALLDALAERADERALLDALVLAWLESSECPVETAGYCASAP